MAPPADVSIGERRYKRLEKLVAMGAKRSPDRRAQQN